LRSVTRKRAPMLHLMRQTRLRFNTGAGLIHKFDVARLCDRLIPLNELPKRLKELDRTKLIVTACPHKDRSALAMAYLKTQGFDVKYLEDGLLGLAELLRGEKAKEVIQ